MGGVVYHRQALHPVAIGLELGDEIRRPDFVGPRRPSKRLSIRYPGLLAPPALHLQQFFRFGQNPHPND